jgi:GAF domain-containing protein
MSWIGLLEDNNKTIYTAAINGFDDGFFTKSKKFRITDAPEGRGPSGTAIREERTFICNDIANDIKMEIWRKEALQRGYQSSIAIPITVRNKTIGAFCLYSDETNAFSLEEEVELLEKITQNISFALETILTEEEHKSDVERILQLSQALEQSPVINIITNKTGNIEYVNPKFSEVTGYSFKIRSYLRG